MKTLILSVAASLLLLVGCSALSGGSAPSVPTIPGVDLNSGKDAANDSMWPFALAGFLGLIGCIIVAWVKKQIPWDALIAAIVIALVPPAFYLILEPWTLYIGLMCMFLGLCVCVYAAYKTYDLISDDIEADRDARAAKEAKP